jgi:hypothetical protein
VFSQTVEKLRLITSRGQHQRAQARQALGRAGRNEFKPVHDGHVHVAHQNVRPVAAYGFECFPPVSRFVHHVGVPPKPQAHDAQKVNIIFGYDNLPHVRLPIG